MLCHFIWSDDASYNNKFACDNRQEIIDEKFVEGKGVNP